MSSRFTLLAYILPITAFIFLASYYLIFTLLPRSAPTFTVKYIPFSDPSITSIISHTDMCEDLLNILIDHPGRNIAVTSKLLESEDLRIRLITIEQLKSIGSEDARQVIIKEIQRTNNPVKLEQLVFGLSAFHGDSAAACLLDLVNNISKWVDYSNDYPNRRIFDYQEMLVSSLRIVNDGRATMKLMNIAQDETHPYRLLAIEELGHIRDPAICCFLAGILIRDMHIAILREKIYSALEMEDDPRMIPIIEIIVQKVQNESSKGESRLVSNVLDYLNRPKENIRTTRLNMDGN